LRSPRIGSEGDELGISHLLAITMAVFLRSLAQSPPDMPIRRELRPGGDLSDLGGLAFDSKSNYMALGMMADSKWGSIGQLV
jgi:hypothetical protein